MNDINVMKTKKKKIGLCIVGGAVLCILLVVITILSEVYVNDTDKKIAVEIPKGAGVSRIAQILEENDVIDSPFLFKIYEKLIGGGIYHSGVHEFCEGMSYGNVLDTLECHVNDNVTIVIPEGYEIYRVAKLLEEKGICTEEKFYEAQEEVSKEFSFLKEVKKRENILEGYLFPDTYEFEKGQDAKDVIRVMLSNFESRVLGEYKQSGTEKTLDEIIIMASIVEREAANDNEWGKVASVFYNRLEIGMKLQSCATVQYILEERKDILTNADIKIDSPYNTYMYEGLPLGPVASPGLGAIKAAIYPEDTDYLYFAATKDGSRNVFSKTGEEHMKTVEELQK